MLSALAAMAACNSAGTDTEPASDQDTTTEVAEAQQAQIEYFGAPVTTENAMTTGEMLTALEGNDSAVVKVQGEISGVCQKKGCWMDIPLENGEVMKVKFKDYDFFVPMNSSGRTATMEGVVRQETFSVEYLRHLAQDAGKSDEEIEAITEPEVKYSFEASGVAIQ